MAITVLYCFTTVGPITARAPRAIHQMRPAMERIDMRTENGGVVLLFYSPVKAINRKLVRTENTTARGKNQLMKRNSENPSRPQAMTLA